MEMADSRNHLTSDWSIESGEEGLRARAMVPPSGTVRGTHIPPGWPHLGRLQVQPGGFWWGGIRHKAMYFTILALNENISISSSVWSRKYVSVRILRTTGVVWYSVSTRYASALPGSKADKNRLGSSAQTAAAWEGLAEV